MPDRTKSEMIKLALRGYSKMNPSRDTQLLISLPTLENITLACEHTKSSQYSRKLIQAMLSLLPLDLVKLLIGVISLVKILLVSVKSPL